MKASKHRAGLRTGPTSDIEAEHIAFPINISLIEDHPLTSASLVDLLDAQPDFNIRHTESESRHLLTALATNTTDAVLVDFFLPDDRWDGIELIRKIRRNHPDLTIVVYTAGRKPDTRSSVFRAGANAFFSKSQPYLLLPNIIRMATNKPDQFFYCDDGKLLEGAPPLLEDLLTLCEVEALRQIAGGLSVTQIADRMIRSKKTVSTHKRRAMRKLEISDDLHLALYIKERYEDYLS